MVARCAFEALAGSVGPAETAKPGLGSAADVSLVLGLGDTDVELDVGGVDGGGDVGGGESEDLLGLGDVFLLGGGVAIVPGGELDAQGLLPTGLVVPGRELCWPTGPLECAWVPPLLRDDPPVPVGVVPECGGPVLELVEMACGTSMAM
jgi:hypothetical protein